MMSRTRQREKTNPNLYIYWVDWSNKMTITQRIQGISKTYNWGWSTSFDLSYRVIFLPSDTSPP